MTETATRTVQSRLITRIDLVELRVRDIDRSIAFYGPLVGLSVVNRGDDWAELGPAGGRTILRFSSSGVTERANPHSTGLFHTAFLYPDRRSLGEALSRVADAGYAIGAGDHLVSEALYVDDPDGNGVELYRDRPREQWPPPAPGDLVAMATEPVDLNSLLNDALSHGPIRKEAPADTGVGHVHLQVADVEETVRFYTDVLGLDLMTRFGSQAGFFASGGYHHHIGANAWRSRAQEPAEPHTAGLSRVTFETTTEELAALRARLRDAATTFEEGSAALELTEPNGVSFRFISP